MPPPSTHYGNQQLFVVVFNRKMGSHKLFSVFFGRGTTYLSENGPHMRKTLLSYMNNKGADHPAHPHSLNSAFVVRCLDSNEYSTKLHTSTGSYVQPVRCGKRLIITCTSVSLSFTLQERCYTDSVYLSTGVDVDCL